MRNLLLHVCLSCLIFVIVPATAEQDKYALVGGLLIDGTGSQPLRNSIILVNGERIEAVGAIGRLPIPDGYRLVSTEGMTVMPGLWDPHVHLLYNGHPDFGHWFSTYSDRFGSTTIPASAEQFLMAGVTSVRDLAVNTDDIVEVRQRITAGDLIGPTIYTSGAALMLSDAPATMPHITPVATPAAAIRATRNLIDKGMDIIKVLGATEQSREVLDAIVKTAHAGGVRVTAHGRLDEELRVALKAGVDEIQHIGIQTPSLPVDILDLVEARTRSGNPLYWNPTIGTILNADELAADPEWLEDPKNFAGLPADIEQDIRLAIASAEFTQPAEGAEDTIKRKIQSLSERGVIFTFGSDEGTFGLPASEATWRELEAWVFELGMDPLVALKWATADSAAYMGVADQVGTITPGKLADIIAVKGSPLRHFSTMREPVMVIRHGSRFK